jgi:hypothetical protein
VAGRECKISNAGQAGAQRKAGQYGAVECIVSDCNDAVGDHDGGSGQALATLKRSAADVGDGATKRDIRQGDAIIEGIASHFGHTVGNGNAGEGAAESERKGSQCGDIAP